VRLGPFEGVLGGVHVFLGEEVPLLPLKRRAQQRLDGTSGRRSSPTPSFTRRSVTQVRREPAFTYAMELVGAVPAAFKIGWAFDYGRRARTFNQASMPELGGLRYKSILFEQWDTALGAFSMEQRVLRHFNSHRHSANHEILTGVRKDDLVAYWTSLLTPGRSPRQGVRPA
jgi:hypothetical protein